MSDYKNKAHINATTYQNLYAQSLTDPDTFWAAQAQRLDWISFPAIIKNASFTGDVSIKWYEDGILNASVNCIDRHLKDKAQQTAIIWQGDEIANVKHITYQQLHDETCRMGNALKSLGIIKGDRVIIYLPMIPEAVYAMLACARIGAVHSVVFGGFSPQSLASRINDAGAKLVITADEGVRGGKHVPLKTNTDAALQNCSTVEKVLVVKRTGTAVPMAATRDIWWHDLREQQSPISAPAAMQAEDPLFTLYTSGSTGTPKGVLHTTGGYLTYVSLTHQLVFDYRPGDVYFCTADVGWITGHSYLVYGPLANGATVVMFEGVPTYPDAGRFWQIIEQHKVNSFYTAPTAIRALMREGDAWVEKYDCSFLRVLGSVGEPINPEAWQWYYNVVGDARCPIVDTYWQTETGGHVITPLPTAAAVKPGSATRPFFGIKPVIVDNDGKILNGIAAGNLCIAAPWPGIARSIYGDHARFIDTYFKTYPGLYFTGDGARRDQDGDYWITGRVDDVMNVSGHRLATAEIEAVLNSDPRVAESAVVGVPHDIKGQGIYAYVILKNDAIANDSLEKELKHHVRTVIGPLAMPDIIHIAPALPKTRSGKIMRRILRKIAAGEADSLGDISTLAEPNVVADLIKKIK